MLPPLFPHSLKLAIRAEFFFFTSSGVDVETASHMILSQNDQITAFVEHLRAESAHAIANFMIALSPFTHTDVLAELVNSTLKHTPAIRTACSCNPMTSVESLLILSVDPVPDVSLIAEQSLNSRIRSQTRVAVESEWSQYHSGLSWFLSCISEEFS